MIKHVRQLKALLTRVSLSSEEKAFIRESVLSYIQMRPASYRARLAGMRPFPLSVFPAFGRAVPVSIVAVLVLAGVALAAENTLPGDRLYAVKVNVTERVLSVVAVGSEADAGVQAALAERRLKEAELLAVSGRLNDETSALIGERFRTHTEKVRGHIENIEASYGAEAAAEVSTEVQVILQAHGRILASIGETLDPQVRESIEPFLSVLTEELVVLSEPTEKIELDIAGSGNSAAARTVVESKRLSAQKAIADSRAFFEANKADFSMKTQEQFIAQLDMADELVVEGSANLRASLYTQAFRLFTRAQSIAQEAQVVLKTAKELNLEVEVDGTSATGTPSLATSTPTGGATSTPPAGAGDVDLNINLDASGAVERAVNL